VKIGGARGLNRLSLAAGSAGVFVALHLLAPLGDAACAWGVDSLAGASASRRALFAAAGLALLVLALRRRPPGARVLRAIDPWRSRRHALLVPLLAAGAAAVFFAAGRSAVHLLGDGLLHLQDLELLTSHGLRVSEVSWANFNAPLSTWLIASLHRAGATFWSSPETTYRIASVLAGALYVAACFPAARRLGRERAERNAVLALLLSGGYLQLFCGYVETYAILMPFLVLYATSALAALSPERPLWAPAAILGAIVPLHFELATLVPSLIALAFLRGRGSSRMGAPAAALLALVVSAAVSAALLLVVRFDVVEYLRQPRFAFLPLLDEPNARQGARLLSPSHLADVANQWALVAPGALLAIPFVRDVRKRPELALLLSMAVFPVLFTLAGNPEVGAFRDWDAFAFAAVPLTLWAGAALVRSVRADLVAPIALAIAGASALHTLAWIDVNADARRAEERFARLLAHCRVSRHALSYGWETLGSLQQRESRMDDARASFEKAAAAARDNPRLWLKAGELNLLAERNEDAIRFLSEVVAADPAGKSEPFAEASFLRGVAHFRRGALDDAVRDFERTIERDPRHVRAHYNLALVRMRMNQPDEAVRSLVAALAVMPDFATAHETLGSLLLSQGRIEEAGAHLARALELEPGGPRAAEIERRLREIRRIRETPGNGTGSTGGKDAPTGRSTERAE
jgi:tetratricopeptide (TPR) repeat protein